MSESLHVDHALACRIEGAVGEAAAGYTAARAHADSGVGARVERHPGFVLTDSGPDGAGNANAAFAMGMSGAVTHDDIIQVEAFFAGVRPPRVETTPYAHPSLFSVLLDRGFRILRHSAVLAVDPRTLPACPTPRVRQGTAKDLDSWLFVQSATYGSENDARAAAASAPIFVSPRAGFIAEVDGRPAALGGLDRVGTCALLMAGMTHPAHRGLGLQRELLEARLHHAREMGVTLAVSEAEHGSTSERNLRRAGFTLVFTRTTFEKPSLSPAH